MSCARRSDVHRARAIGLSDATQHPSKSEPGSPSTTSWPYSFAERSRRAFAITDTELKDIASAAIIGLNKSPNAG